jgi:thiamine biosynthesis lipoprotein ApbE
LGLRIIFRTGLAGAASFSLSSLKSSTLNSTSSSLKVLDRAAQRREKLKKEKQDEFDKAMQRKREQLALQQKYSVTATADPNHLVFKLNDEEAQEKSFIHPDLAKMLDEEDKAKAASSGEKKNKKKKNKK